MRVWNLVEVDKSVIETLGGLKKNRERLIKVLNNAYGYTFDEKTFKLYPDYFEIMSPDGNQPTRKDKKNFAEYFMKEFSEFELYKTQEGISSLFNYNKKKEDMGSEKLRKIYEKDEEE